MKKEIKIKAWAVIQSSTKELKFWKLRWRENQHIHKFAIYPTEQEANFENPSKKCEQCGSQHDYGWEVVSVEIVIKL